MRDYKGFGKAPSRCCRPSACPPRPAPVAEAQSYALIADDSDAHENGLRRSQGGLSRRHSRPGSDAVAAAKVTALTGIDALSHALESYVTTKRNPLSQMFRPGGLEAARKQSGKGAGQPRRPGGPRRHADGGLPGRHRHRELDARRLPCLRQPADGPLRHHARPGHRHPAAARDPFQCQGVGDRSTAN